MAEVFVSYARMDQGFARDLSDALKKVNRDTWIDWRSIPDSAQWRGEIFAAIEAADNFLFLISPDSLHSWMCGQEVAHALSNKKRIVTILYHPVDPKELIVGLEEIQWINYPELGFDKTFQRLIKALDTDLEWVRQHTRLGGKARDWERNDYNDSFLLRGIDLQDAIKWLAKAALVQEPKASSLQEQYIRASQEWEAAEIQRLRRMQRTWQSEPAAGTKRLPLFPLEIVSRLGDASDHSIANSKAEYWRTWLGAIGGGVLMVLPVALTWRIIEAGLPPFFQGVATGTNYAVSFLLLQIFGLVLAIKQPATTAAAFAQIIRDNRGTQRSAKITDFVARITSTQLAAAIGNVAAVSAGAVLFEKLWRVVFLESYLPALSAEQVYDTLNPWASGTALYAIVTGLSLGLAVLAGNWMEDAAAYYRLAKVVAQHPVGSRVEATLSRKLPRIVKHNISGWGTSIVLGYLLGFAPVFGQFFGLPIDVRHVTLSSGMLALATARFGTATLGGRWFLHAVEAIPVIFLLNLVGSLTIPVLAAVRAFDVPPREQLTLVRSLFVGMIRSPVRFIVPVYAESQGSPREAKGQRKEKVEGTADKRIEHEETRKEGG